MEKLSIFLSHLTVESRLADILKAHLTQDFIGLVDVFVSSDRTSIPVGAKWLAEVTSALDKASIHLVLCSPDSVTRPWIQFEAGAAQIRGIPIIPICHSGLAAAQLPVPLSVWEGIEAATADGIRKLYDSIAAPLGSNTPGINFEAYAAEVVAFEKVYRANRASTIETSGDPTIEVIQNPRVICVSSQQFFKLGFENQIQIVLEAFPANIAHERVFTSADLRDRLSHGRFDIVHIAAFVCPRTGDLYFSEVDTQTGKATGTPVDKMSAEALCLLLKMAQTKLVVITSCESLVMAANLVAVTNVVATSDMISPQMMAVWVESFYKILQSQPLSQALDFAAMESRAPMRYYGRQTQQDEMLFKVESPKGGWPTQPT
jgi:hypothetical protein